MDRALCSGLLIAVCAGLLGAMPAAAAKITQEKLQQLLQQYPDADADGDGVLTPEEAWWYRRTIKDRRGARHHLQTDQPATTNAYGLIPLGVEKQFDPDKVVNVSNRKIKAFLLIGQSNMVGHGEREGYKAKYREQKNKTNTLRLYPDGWGPVQLFERNGPEISFAHAMAEAWPNSTIGIVKIAIGGTGIRAFLPEWDPKQAGPDVRKGPIYNVHIRPRIELARKLCPNIEFMGVLWKQGGADMQSRKLAEGYLGHLETIITALRRDTGVNNLPLFIGTYLNREGLAQYADKRDKIAEKTGRKAAYEVLEAQVQAPDRIPATRIAVHGELPVHGDGVHFTAKGQTALGKCFAETVLDYYKK